ncbi:16S rRNA (guanine(527)-N(7))-methyltransferase RsmG [uncultured Sphingomonas sp.]|uniref:16S rRNA (guanine(527)-N(7))-methyltransferase RsmG n=1 Tax=uncultured Sphingomonas sp. TaxID=158754 RepID=UPI0025D519B4|nr:16S rRNA (guanine(527)-N(7))-methyltransferase RsmG [uncultured Sphingomonas sp.]
MTEEEARAWLLGRNVPRETLDLLEQFLAFLLKAGESQNLISASTHAHLWTRHVVDSAQLLDHVSADDSPWLDLGSGAGFPGLVIAALTRRPVTLVESRTKRIQFLRDAAQVIGAENRVTVVGGDAERVTAQRHGVISARAFAPLPRLLQIGSRFADESTCWLLPKGRNAASELVEAEKAWQGRFTLVPSVTDVSSSIVIAREVSRRTRP